MDITHKTEFKVRDLGTAAVTLFPSRAQITREIKGIDLKPGTNEITIVGITPTVDEDSIKVEGNGSATITDIAVDLIPNSEIFEEVYPESDDESDSDAHEDDEDEPEAKSEDIRSAEDKVTNLQDSLTLAREAIASAAKRLEILDLYGNTFDRKRGTNIEDGLEKYKAERAKAFEDQLTGRQRERELRDLIVAAVGEVAKLQRQDYKDKAKANKEKEKARKVKAKEDLIKARRKAEVIQEKERVRAERRRFWPKVCYSVRITVEAASFTPSSSRRGSISSEAEFSKLATTETEGSQPLPPQECDIVLSYVTTAAHWLPSYDLRLSTTNNSASLYFDAKLTNFTSETWSNCKVTLSTSQTTFAGLDDAIPTLMPWHIRLFSRGNTHGYIDNDVLRSQEERNYIESNQLNQRQAHTQKPWSQFFGAPDANDARAANMMILERKNRKRAAQREVKSKLGNIAPASMLMQHQMMQQQQQQQQQQQRQSMAYGASMQPQIMAAAAVASRPPPKTLGGGIQRHRRIAESASSPPRAGGWAPGGGPDDSEDSSDEKEETTAMCDLELELDMDLDFQDSVMEETGFTTTYDLPGLKTLVPKAGASKQRVARVQFANVIFGHTVVAKYKPAAYLKAKLKNNSKLTLLKGQAGLTLDGTFMGKTPLPRCSAGDSFTMSLGVDPAIKVIYPKPEVRRATSGLFNKENSSVYIRTITLQNTRGNAGKAVQMLVLDQVPVSEDERLRVELVDPRGLSLDGPGIAAGAPGRNTREDKDWGRATARFKKGGEVNWDVSLNAGRAVKLTLEYSVASPQGETPVQC